VAQKLLADKSMLVAAPPGWENLNNHQRAIVQLTAQGLTNAQIANKLCQATGTIKNQKTVIISHLMLGNQHWHSLSYFVMQHYAFLSQLPPATG
jgi:DNA-binding NarL/FixJ family response regulator